MKKLLIIALVLLAGCATTNVNDLSVANRSIKFSVANIIVFEKTTEGLNVGLIETTDEQ
jgi:hypothetical protein